MNTNNATKSQQNTIEYVDGLCGSGKTHSLTSYIKQNQSLCKKYMIITPSIILAEQIQKQFEEKLRFCFIHTIHSKNTDNVASKIMSAIEEIDHDGVGVIICTQQAFPTIPFFQNKHSWTLIVDEIPKIDSFYCPSLPYSHGLLTEYVEVDEQLPNKLYKMKLSDNSNAFVNRNYDSIDAVIKPIVVAMQKHHECFADETNWNKLVVSKQITSDQYFDITYGNSSNKLYFLIMLTPDVFTGFQKVIMMGANFEHSLLYKYWSEYKNVNFKVCEEISSQLRYRTYQNGQRLTLIYLQEEKWSKYSSNKSINNVSRETYYAKLVNEEMHDKKLIFMANNDSKVSEDIIGTKIPVISHGINSHDSCDNIYFSPALNRQPMYTKMINSLGIDSVFIDRASAHETAHQGIMRTSMRNPDATTNVTAIVVDKATAEEIARLFPSCHIKAINGAIKKVVQVTQSDKNRNVKLNQIKRQYELNAAINDEHLQVMNGVGSEKKSTKFITNEICTKNLANNEISIALLSTIYNKSIAQGSMNTMSFIKELKSFFTNDCISSKDENVLFNGTKYKDDLSRGLENVAYANFVVLDIDDGDLSPEEFLNIFKKKNKHSMIMMNSFSRSEDKPNNYRVIFFTKEKMTDESYRLVHKYIQSILKSHGYITASKNEQLALLEKDPSVKFSGIDLTKTHTASFFYLPCRVSDRIKWSFFERCNVQDNDELLRHAIDPTKVIQSSLEKTELPTLVYENTTNKASFSNVIDLGKIKQQLMSGDYKHLGGHENYGRLAAAMKVTGFDLNEFIEVTQHVSYSKTLKDAETYWKSWGKYTDITSGTLLYMLKNKS